MNIRTSNLNNKIKPQKSNPVYSDFRKNYEIVVSFYLNERNISPVDFFEAITVCHEFIKTVSPQEKMSLVRMPGVQKNFDSIEFLYENIASIQIDLLS